jgi:hypothetical protein
MKTLRTAVLLAALGVAGSAQTLTLQFDALADRAKEKAEINLDPATIQAAGKLVPAGLQSIQMRAYEFAKSGEFSARDLEPLRKQVAADKAWSRIVNIHDSDDVLEVYLYKQNGKASGFLLIATEDKELTVIHCAGAVALAQVQELVQSSIHYDPGKLAELK